MSKRKLGLVRSKQVSCPDCLWYGQDNEYKGHWQDTHALSKVFARIQAAHNIKAAAQFDNKILEAIFGPQKKEHKKP